MTTHSDNAFGLRVRQHREVLGLTRKELAQRVSCSIETIRKIESGERYPSVQLVELLAKNLAFVADEQPSRRSHLQKTQPRSPHLVAAEYPLIGRQAEQDVLRTAWRKAMHGAAHLVCITGDAGIGKTRLAEELLADAQREGYLVTRTRAYALEGRLAYAPVADWLRSAALAARVNALPAVWRTEIARLLPELLSQDVALPPPQPLTERWQVKRLFEALLQAFSTAAQQAPVLLVLDDLQWCDPETLDWLQYVLSAAPHLKLLLVGTVRDTEVDANHPLHKLWRALLQDGQLTQLPLMTLSRAETAQLGAAVLQCPLDAPIAESLFDACAGNPLFVIESVRFQHNSHSQPQTAPMLYNELTSLPPRVYAVLQARLAGLSPVARAMAAIAAVMGRTFTLPLLARAGGWDEAQTAQCLDELLQRRLVRKQSDAQLDFSHDRIRDVAYAEVGAIKRKLLHCAVAQTLESLHADNLDAIAGELAGHYQQADDLERALRYFRQAASVADRLYAHCEVVRYLERAIAIVQMKPDKAEFKSAEIDLWLELGFANVWIYGYGSSPQGEAWTKAHTLAMQAGTVFQRTRVLSLLSTFASNRSEIRISFDYAQLILPLAQDSGDAYLIASAISIYGRSLYHFGELDQALIYFQRALALVGSPDQAADRKKWNSLYYGIFVRLTKSLWLLGFPDQANNDAGKTLMDIHAQVNMFDRFGPLSFCAQLYTFARNFEMVRTLGQSLIEMSTTYEFLFFRFSGQSLYGWALAHLGDTQAGVALVREGVKGEREQGSYLFASYNRGLLAEVLALAGQHKEALDEVDAGLAFANEKGNVYWNAHLLKLKGDLLQALGAPDSEAETWYQQALSLARAQCARSLELRAAMGLARLWQKQGCRAQARQLLAPIYGWFTEGFDTPDLVEARVLLDELTQPL